MNVLPKFIILTWLAFALGSYLAVREYRTLAGNGFVKYGKAYRTALLTFTVTGLICAFYTYILYKFLSPGHLEQRMLEAKDAMHQFGWSEDFIKEATTIHSF